ncbi:MAG: cytochrome C assembly protein [Chloroflexi bacterium]|nr:cytochrome C assembly protein [Chloroflexota bacterium]MYD47875.1 cytochrome C assembly protein [Chloroflexota bacterium]
MAGQPTRKTPWRAAIRDARLWLLLLAAVLTLVDGYLIFVVAPTDAVLGHIQRIFYIHVPISILSFLGFLLCAIAGIGYLIRRGESWDRLAHASAEVGVVFVTLALITGVIWARPVWGVWWTWEPRLTTTLILWFIYVAYLMIRQYAPTPQQGRVWSAVVGIIGFVDVPIVYYSVQWWRSIHPVQVIGPEAADDALEPIMARILIFSLVATLALFGYLLLERMALRKTEDTLAQLRRDANSD